MYPDHRKIINIILGLLVLSFSTAFGATYYVDNTGGSDTNGGLSAGSAWEHVQKACTTMVAGDTVYIRSGTYDESSPYTSNIGGLTVNRGLVPANNGTSSDYIVFKGYPGDVRPIIIGKSSSTGSNLRNPALLDSKSYVIYDSIEFRFGYRGIYTGTGHDLIIRNCVIDSTLGPENNNNGGFITFNNNYGSAYRITIENCEIFHNGQWIGSTATYTPSGNTSGIHIYACDSCVFRDNLIHDQEAGIHIKGPLTGSRDTTEYIKIYGNEIYDCNYGIWAVHQGYQRDIEAYNNVLYDINGAGLVLHIGGSNTHVGKNITYYNNTVDCGGVASGVQSRWGNHDGCSVFNNIFYNPAYNASDYKAGHGFKNEGMTPTNYYEDYNLYYGRSDGNYFVWPNGTGYTLSGWQSATDDGDHSTVENPMFTSVSAHDYTLLAGSPAESGGRGGAYPTYRGALGTSSADETEPMISSVQATSIGKYSATITWITNESATSQVEYGKTGSYGSSTTYNSSLVTSHSEDLTGLDSNTIYYYRVISEDASGNENISGQYTFTTAAEELEEIGVGITPVVSSSYTGYDGDILTDGTIDPYSGSSTTWASTESSTEAHWIELNFGSDKTVESINMCWAWNDYRSAWMTSQQYRIQTWDGDDFVDVQTVTPTSGGQSSVDLSTPLVTSRLRLYQPANMGPSDYTEVMWLTEVQVFGSNEPGTDTTPPSPISNLQGQ